VGQVVEVSTETPLLLTETSSLGHVVESRVVQQMPLNGRNVLNLVALEDLRFTSPLKRP
jgi:hypothetical protein